MEPFACNMSAIPPEERGEHPGEDEDFGQEQISGNSADRYAFRTSPLRNVALQPSVRDGLLDPEARPEKLCKLVPKSLPSGRAVADFEDCN